MCRIRGSVRKGTGASDDSGLPTCDDLHAQRRCYFSSFQFLMDSRYSKIFVVLLLQTRSSFILTDFPKCERVHADLSQVVLVAFTSSHLARHGRIHRDSPLVLPREYWLAVGFLGFRPRRTRPSSAVCYSGTRLTRLGSVRVRASIRRSTCRLRSRAASSTTT